MIATVRKGSALLIVLGMASFMMVSAVGFAIYMRESRAPSSHLRRQITARYLLKAALANAIDRLDRGIGDDPYPGVGPNAGGKGGNRWSDRVFMPGGETRESQTVPTLTLEALAYLPPAIINEVRIDSRKTPTATWSNLSYEFGRYAFTAVNVSDCFDINRLSVENRRTSLPDGRISLGSLFEGAAKKKGSSPVEKLKTVLDKKESGDFPYFISLADFNLAAGKGNDFSPFCSFIGTAGTTIYSKDDSAAPAISNALFITDTWFPPTNRIASASSGTAGSSGAVAIDLDRVQPFEDYEEGASVEAAVKEPSDAQAKVLNSGLFDRIGGIGLCCLYDYLDRDSRPVSFCLPTTETVPMVTGVGFEDTEQLRLEIGRLKELKGSFKPEVKKNGETIRSYTREAVQYGITSLAQSQVTVRGIVTYPFRRAKAKGYKTSFSADVMLRIWWAPRNVSARLNVNSPIYPGKNDWKDGVGINNGIISCCKTGASFSGLTYKDEPTTEEAVGTFSAEMELESLPKMPLFWHIRDTTINNGKSSTDEYCVMDGLKGEGNLFRPYTAAADQTDPAWQAIFDGATDEGPAKDGNTGLLTPEEFSGTKVSGNGLGLSTYTMHVAAWVRVKDGDKVVDLVPARIADDSANGLGSWPEGSDMQDPYLEMFAGGEGAPILEFRGDDERDLELTAAKLEELEKKNNEHGESFGGIDCLLCCDPRWNWAPENWFSTTSAGGNGPEAKTWIDSLESVLGKNGRDPDIFMFTSDCEWLQSIGELAFLPFVGWGTSGGQVLKDEIGEPFNGVSVVGRKGPSDCACEKVFWRSYSPDRQDFESFTDYSGKRLEIASGGTGFRVNPFSRDPRVLGAALRNTPFDYFITCPDKPSYGGRLNTKSMTPEEALKYAFNAEGDLAYVADDVMEDIISGFRGAMGRMAADKNENRWENVFSDSSMWFEGTGDEQLRLFGVELDDPLYGVDRKFLRSYWRECFQNRQQLFLIFLRAEPLSVGGASGDTLANAQLGARGVALVWRDPLPQGKSVKGLVPPHRTRILFYHQFD